MESEYDSRPRGSRNGILNNTLYICFNQTARGTCTNVRTITRQEVEQRVLRAMKERLFAPSAFAEFCKAFTEEMNRLRREHRVQVAAAPREIATLNRRSDEILELLLKGFSDERWKDELRRIEERRAETQRPHHGSGGPAAAAGVAPAHGAGVPSENGDAGRRVGAG